ncbi:MAG: hypothetical protein PHE21_00145 [Candidatus Dojkabacteria bacterium]|nr:hypothetical protein [Candidatus Dojkabacteria bacterium]
MKILNIKSNKFKTFLKSINLLDGQRRGEVVFRRFFFLVAMGMLIYLLLLTFVGRKGEVKVSVDPAPEKVQAQEIVIEDKEEWVDGDKVTTKADGTVEVVPAEVFMESSTQAVKRFTQSYSGSKIDDKYFTLLDKYCSDEALRTVVAISVAETSMGRNTSRKTNFYGWFKGGNRSYDPDMETMAREICTGVQKSYIGIGTDSAKSRKYVGHDTTNWLKNYRWAYAQMEVK